MNAGQGVRIMAAGKLSQVVRRSKLSGEEGRHQNQPAREWGRWVGNSAAVLGKTSPDLLKR